MNGASVMRSICVVFVALTPLVVSATARADALGAITGQVVDANGSPLSGICVDYQSAPYGATAYPVSATQTDANGDYTLALSPGPYLIDFRGCGQNYVTQYYPAQPDPQTAGTVTVVNGQTTSGIDAQMESAAQSPGRCSTK